MNGRDGPTRQRAAAGAAPTREDGLASNHPDTAPGAGEASLAQLLAVLWRRRLVVLGLTGLGVAAGFVYILVTKPLYRATASVRPGITAYTDLGGPVREWKLKDVTFWFDRGLYAEQVRETLGWPRDWPRPIIEAKFIARGSQNIQGGDVITLQTLSPEPGAAVEILEAAIDAFNTYAAADTLASGLALTRAGLEVRLAALANDRARLLTKRERIDLNIEETKKQLASIDAEKERVGLELGGIESANRLRQSLLAEAERQAQAASASREELERLLSRLTAGQEVAVPDSLVVAPAERTVAPWLLESLRRGDAGSAGTAAASVLALRRFEQRNRTLADSLRYEIELAASEVTDLQLKRDVDLEKERAAILTRVGDLHLQREQDIETERAEIDQRARGFSAQLAALSPLERIGKTQVSVRPVRPRRLRAVALSALAGAFGSLVCAFALDYLAAHRDEILGRRPSA